MLGSTVVLAVAVAAGCFMSADPSRYVDGAPKDAGAPDVTMDVTPDAAPDATPDAPLPDAPLPDIASDLAAPDAPLADAPLPDAGLATYYRTWSTATVVTKPPKVWGCKAVYQGSTGKVLLYGGTDSQVSVAQMWSYDGTDWQKVCDPCPPGPRVGHGMVWDASRDVVVLFGGKDGTTLMNDVWELSGGTWKQVTPAGTGPSVRWGAYMAHDPVRGRTVVFGGLAAGSVRKDDLYEYDGTSWYGPYLPAVRPAGRTNYGNGATFAGAQALVASARNRVVIFGGETASKVTADDCWAWDGTSWTVLCTACTQTPRTGAALGYDPATGRLVVVNGWTGSNELAGTYEQLSQFWAQTTPLPGARDHSAMTFDVKRNRFVLYGGNGPGCGGDCDETLEYVAP